MWCWVAGSPAEERGNRGKEEGKRRRSHDAVRRSSPAPVLAAHAWVWRDPRDPRRSPDPRQWKRENCGSPELPFSRPTPAEEREDRGSPELSLIQMRKLKGRENGNRPIGDRSWINHGRCE
jgi:hypothetical protein